MNPDDEEREQDSGSGDIFEDLDKFFTPIEETEWAETGKPPAAPPSTPTPGDTVGAREYMPTDAPDEPEGAEIPGESISSEPEEPDWQSASREGDAGGWGEEPDTELGGEEPEAEGAEEPDTAVEGEEPDTAAEGEEP